MQSMYCDVVVLDAECYELKVIWFHFLCNTWAFVIVIWVCSVKGQGISFIDWDWWPPGTVMASPISQGAAVKYCASFCLVSFVYDFPVYGGL